jgi:hypothetical protein
MEPKKENNETRKKHRVIKKEDYYKATEIIVLQPKNSANKSYLSGEAIHPIVTPYSPINGGCRQCGGSGS